MRIRVTASPYVAWYRPVSISSSQFHPCASFVRTRVVTGTSPNSGAESLAEAVPSFPRPAESEPWSFSGFRAEAVPAFVTLAMIVFTYNIANGLTAGLIVHPLLKAVTARWREIKPGAVVLALLCLVYYVFGLTH